MEFYTISSVYQSTAPSWHQHFLHFLFKLFILCPAVIQRYKAVAFLRYFWKQEEYRIVPASACKWECCCYLKTTILEPHLSGCHTADMTGVQFFSLILQKMKVLTIADDWVITMWMWQLLHPPHSSSQHTHTHRQKCSFALTTGCCWFQLAEPTSDTGTLESLLIGWSFRSACVKGNWGQTVDQDKKRFKEWQKGGTEGGERGRQTWPI